MKSKPYHLTTIRFSHYNEKARWGLDWFHLPYIEHPYMPMMHYPAAMAASRFGGKADKTSTMFSTPIMKTPSGRVFTDSSEILRYLSDTYSTPTNTLFPSKEADESERHWSLELAPHTRRYIYFAVLGDLKMLRYLAEENVPSLQARAFHAIAPVARSFVMKGLHINPKSAAKSREAILRQWEIAEARLEKGTPYLSGDKFSAADLSFACAAAPILLVTQDEGYAAVLPTLAMVGGEAEKMGNELRHTRAGKHALRMFKEHRGKRIIPCKPSYLAAKRSL